MALLELQKYIAQRQCVCFTIISIIPAALMTWSNECSRFFDSFKIRRQQRQWIHSVLSCAARKWIADSCNNIQCTDLHTYIHRIRYVNTNCKITNLNGVIHQISWLTSLCQVIFVWVSMLYVSFFLSLTLFGIARNFANILTKWNS